MKVKVYYNLHNHKWSIQHNGLVLGHADEVVLTNVTPKVSQAGRERVLREKKKNVHAFLCGDLVNVNNFVSFRGRSVAASHIEVEPDCNEEITYNPYKYDKFVDKKTEWAMVSASMVHMKKDRRCFANKLIMFVTNNRLI